MGNDKKNPKEWEKLRHTATKTEIAPGGDTTAKDLLAEAEKKDPAFVVIQGDMVGRVFRLKKGLNLIGRHPDSDILIQQRAVSSSHSEIRVTEDTAILSDLQSTNGTLLNKTKIDRPVVLQAGDLVKVGSYVFKYIDNRLDANFSESLHQTMVTDPLTGAFNKGYILKALASAIEVARTGFPLSLVIFDLDHFKKVNDTYGHIAGDHVLKDTCKVVKESGIRTEDMLGRFGGEEFMIVMPDAAIETASRVAERIRSSIESHAFEYGGTRIPVTASLGVVSWSPAYDVPDKMIEAADQLLYKSKQGGRNRVTVATKS